MAVGIGVRGGSERKEEKTRGEERRGNKKR